MGLTQLLHGSPALPLGGTRPDAMAPATAPMQNGTSTDDVANAAPKLRWLDVRVTSLRKAKLEPRNTMPNAASESGTNSVSVIDANASGNPVHSTTRQKMSQTWFASHTGPIEWLMTGRGAPPARAPPAVRSQNPAPKSAPPNSAYAVIADHQDDGDDVAHVSRSRCCAPGRSGPAPLRAGIPGWRPRRSSPRSRDAGRFAGARPRGS